MLREPITNRQSSASDLEIRLEEFPSTRYQGSKRKIIPWIYDVIRKLAFESALDLFGGTGSVSYLLKKMGKSVTYNDSLRFNYLIGQALIENDSVFLTDQDMRFLLGPPIANENRFVARTFKGMYFTDRENQWIDETCAKISELRGLKHGRIKAALANYALFQACLVKRPFNLFHRKNLYIRRARVRRTFGNKTTWERSFEEHFEHFAREVNRLVFKGHGNCSAMNCDAAHFPASTFDLVYLDPPYLRRDGSHETADYRRCYHFLEGIANYSKWHSMIDFESSNYRLKNGTPNVWCDAERCIDAVDELIGAFPQSIIAISYRKHGVPSLSTLVRLLRRHGTQVRVYTRHYKYRDSLSKAFEA